jgi:hypothetical protein
VPDVLAPDDAPDVSLELPAWLDEPADDEDDDAPASVAGAPPSPTKNVQWKLLQVAPSAWHLHSRSACADDSGL